MPGDEKSGGGGGGGGGQQPRADDVVSVFIPRIRRKQSHVEYVIEVTGKSAVWNIYRRYQQFRDLHNALAKLCSITDNYHTPKGVLPVLPGTSWIRVTSDDVDLVEKRRLHLEIYLQQLLVPSNKFYKDCADLRQFLHQDEMPLNYKNALSKTVPGINAPLDHDPTGSVDRVFDDDSWSEEDMRHSTIISSRPSDAVEPAIAPEIPKMDDWSSDSRKNNDLLAIAGSTQNISSNKKQGLQQQAALLQSQQLQYQQQQQNQNNNNNNNNSNSPTSPLSQTMGAQMNVSERSQNDILMHGQRVTAQSEQESSAARMIPYELCKACGYREDIDFDLDEWVPNGTCRNCGQLTEHDLVVPSQQQNSSSSPTTEADGDSNTPSKNSSLATSAAGSIGGEADARAEARRRAQMAGVPLDDNNLLNNNNNSSPSSSSQTKSSGGGGGGRSPDPEQLQQQQPPKSPLSQPANEPAPKEEQITQAIQSFDARCDISLSDFELITTLGRGTFGKVMKARYKNDGKIYAIKVLSKSMVHQKRMVDYVKEEKAIMAFLPPHPFVVQLHFAFQTDHHLYFVMDFLTGGELYAHMQPLERLPLHAARFYSAELLCAIEHIHKYDVAHRDLKPENIVLSADGHIKLTDFGLARRQFSHKRRFSFVGSAEYLSPEVVRTEGQTKAIDWWGFGCMVYELLTGRTPFHAHTAREVYAAILNRQIDFNRPGMTPEAQDLIAKLVDKNPRTRLQDPAKIRRHAFFAGMNWEHVLAKKIKPPFVPDLTSNDTKYFSKEFTSEWAGIPAAANSSRSSIERLASRFSNFRRIHDHAPTPATSAAATAAASSSLHQPGSGDHNNTPRSEGHTPRASEQQQQPPQRSAASVVATAMSAASNTVSRLHGRTLPTADQLFPLVSLPDYSLESGMPQTGIPRPVGGNLQLKHIDPDEFVGVWRLLRVEMISTTGQVVFPWGAEVAGQLIFTKNGLFSIQICPIKRLKFRGISKPTREEMVEAFQSYVASFGNFFVMPGKPFIVQRATAALSPSLIGVLQKRYFDVDPERKLLKLMTPLYKGEGNMLVFSAMTWSKVA